MVRKNTRDLIVQTADRLFYQQGFEATSFADIAGEVGVSRGNFYHHFKTKDDILDAVISYRLGNTQDMLDRWEVSGNTPKERITSFIHILIVNGPKIQKYGCPVGTLTGELAKLEHPSLGYAGELFSLFRGWLKRQFELMGQTSDADELAMHLLARSQGVATLANAFQDEEFVLGEVALLEDWLQAYDQQGEGA